MILSQQERNDCNMNQQQNNNRHKPAPSLEIFFLNEWALLDQNLQVFFTPFKAAYKYKYVYLTITGYSLVPVGESHHDVE